MSMRSDGWSEENRAAVMCSRSKSGSGASTIAWTTRTCGGRRSFSFGASLSESDFKCCGAEGGGAALTRSRAVKCNSRVRLRTVAGMLGRMSAGSRSVASM